MAKATEDKIRKQLLEFIRAEIVDSSVQLDEETSLRDAGIDSFSVIELVLFLERNFEISIQEKDLLPENFKSVGTLAKCAATYLAE